MGYNYGYGYGGYNSLDTMSTFSAVGLLIAIPVAILVYALFLKSKNDGKFTGFAGWLYSFLNFKKLTLNVLLKVGYIFFAVWITIASFGLITTSFVMFLVTLIFGNLFIRIAYELIMLTVIIARNTNEINDKLGAKIHKKDVNVEKVVETAKAVTEETSEATKEEPVETEPATEEVETAENICPNCGAEYGDDVMFCGKCGAKVR